MKKCILSAAALAAGSLFAQNGTWKYRAGVGSSPANMADWADPENWVNGLVATGIHSQTSFPASVPADFTQSALWVRIPDQFTLGTVKSDLGKNVYLVGQTINMRDTSQGWKSARLSGTKLFTWADLIRIDGDFSPYGTQVYAPFVASGRLTCSYGSTLGRDRFATSADEAVSNLFTATDWGPSNGQQLTLSVPGKKSASTGFYQLTQGSPLVKWVSGTKGLSLAPGQTVTADGFFPAGTFVKRTYSDTYVEMSAPALGASATEDGTELAFSGFTIKFEQEIPKYTGAVRGGVQMTPPDGNATMDAHIRVLNGAGMFYGNNNSYYSNFHFHDLSLATSITVRNNARIIFDGKDGVTEDTLPTLYFFNGPSKKYYGLVDVRVPEGRTTTINALDVAKANTTDADIALSTATLTKTGAGSLVVKSAKAVNPKVSVSAGTMRFDCSAAEAPALESLTVSAGATFTLAAGCQLVVAKATLAANATVQIEEGAELTFQTKTFTAGCRILGPGTVKGLAVKDTANVIFGGNVKLANAAASSTDYVSAYPSDVSTPCVDPVFWVDAKKTDSIVFADGSSTNVKRVNDRRGTDAEYNFATNVASVYPTISGDYILMKKKGKTNIAETQALVWGRPIRGIRAVFVVTTSTSSSEQQAGALLGSTARLGTRHFSKNSITAEGEPIVDDNGLACVKNGKYYINGAVRNRTAGRLGHFPQVMEIHPNAPGGDADAFGYQYGIAYDGSYWLGEVLVYTNELTYAERTQISAYLVNKWTGGKIPYVDFPADGAFGKVQLDGGAAFGAEAGTMAEIDDVQGTGTLVTKGTGTFHLRHFVNPAAGLHVTAGTTKLESFDPLDEAMVPSGAKIRVDASQASSITTNGSGQVTAWNNLGDSATYAFKQGENSSKLATLVADATTPNGMPVVDLGPLVINSEQAGGGKETELAESVACYFGFYKAGTSTVTSFSARSVFGVFGTKYGGNWIISGHESSRTGTQGFYRDPTRDATKSIVMVGSTYDSQAPGYNGTFYGAAQSPVITNGVKKSQIMSTGFSGGYETVGWWSPYGQTAYGIGRSWRRFWAGGLQIGEYLIYSRTLEESEVYKLDAYLGAKWFGRVSPRYAIAKMGPLTVDSGATLDIVGGAPVMATTLSGAGTINGAVSLAENAVFEVPVEADGKITQTLTVSGAVDLSKGGMVQLTGENVKHLKAGKYRLIASAQLGAVDSWTVTGYAGRKILKLKTDASGLWLEVVHRGLVLFVH